MMKNTGVVQNLAAAMLLVLISQESQRMGKVPGNRKLSVVPNSTKDKRSKFLASWPSFSTELSEHK